MKKISFLVLIMALGVLAGIFALDYFTVETCAQDKCAKYYGKGYCTDYIKQRTGNKQRGNAGTWTTNIQTKEVRQGDVIIFKSPGVGHVAVVERVIYERNTDKPYQVEISEMNWGRASSDAEKKACYVTEMFNQVGRRTVKVSDSSIKGFWRP